MTLYQTAAPYEFSKLHALLRRYPAPALFRLSQDRAYYRALGQADAGIGLLRASSAEQGLEVELIASQGHVSQETATAHIARILGFQIDLTTFYDFARHDKTLWAVVEPNCGLPVYRTESLFQALVFVIIEQHISWVAAQRAQQALVHWGGQTITHEDTIYYAMPTPQQLAQASVEDLKPLKITFRRMELLIRLSQQIVSGTLDLDEMGQLSSTELYDALIAIKGVGHWTASVVISRWLGQFDFVPHNDVALQAATSAYFDIEKSASATREHFAKYGEFAGLAAHFTLMRWVLDEYPVQS